MSDSPYLIAAVKFDGATFIQSSGAFSCTDNGKLSISCWIGLDAPQTANQSMFIWGVDPVGDYSTYFELEGPNFHEVGGDHAPDAPFFIAGSPGPDYTHYLDCGGSAPINTNGGFSHLLASLDFTTGHIRIFRDGVDMTIHADTNGSDIMQISGKPQMIGHDTFTAHLIANVADLWVAPGVSLLDTDGNIPDETVAMFRSASGKPVDLGADGSTPTGTTPAIYLSRRAGEPISAFVTNRGNGGTFAVAAGALVEAASSPSDRPRVVHNTQSTEPDSNDGKISSDAWNEDHLIEGLGSAAESNVEDFAATTHAHAIADVTALQAALDSKQASGAYLLANQTITFSGDATGSGATTVALTIANGAVSLAKMANMATGSLIYRKTAGTGAPEVQTLTTLKADLGLTGANSGDQDLSSYATTSALTTGLAAKESTIPAGTTAQYWRGDKSWQTLNATAVGLGNVDNTSDANKPVSTAQATAIALKASTSSLAPIATSGSASDLSAGTLPTARLPALTGDVSSSAGSNSVTVTARSKRTVFLASGTWTKDSRAVSVKVEVYGGGGSGAGGQLIALGTALSGGGGGGGGGRIEELFAASTLGATETVTVGTGGAASAVGSSGSAGGNSSIGSWLTAYGGGGGAVGQSAAAAGAGGSAGLRGAGGSTTSSTQGTAGSLGGLAGGASLAATTNTGLGGGSGGSGVSAGNGNPGGGAVFASAAGGAGGGLTAAGGGGSGGDGGATCVAAAQTGPAAGSSAAANSAAINYGPGRGGAGGGGGGLAAGNGADGQSPGGGGGGGGSNQTTRTAGTGGAGGAGLVVVTEFF